MEREEAQTNAETSPSGISALEQPPGRQHMPAQASLSPAPRGVKAPAAEQREREPAGKREGQAGTGSAGRGPGALLPEERQEPAPPRPAPPLRACAQPTRGTGRDCGRARRRSSAGFVPDRAHREAAGEMPQAGYLGEGPAVQGPDQATRCRHGKGGKEEAGGRETGQERGRLRACPAARRAQARCRVAAGGARSRGRGGAGGGVGAGPCRGEGA